MSIQYVSQDEIMLHEAAMQRVVEDERNEREAIDQMMKMAIKAAQKAFDDAVKNVKDKADREHKKSHGDKGQKLAAMQRDFDRLPLLRQVYHEAPDDVFELIVSKCSDVDEFGRGRGGLNAFRLANKRLKQVVESCTTKLMNRQAGDGPEFFPAPIIQRCRRIEEIICHSHNLKSLEGCPVGLKRLLTLNAPILSDLSPLASCSMMMSLEIFSSSITEISVVSSMPLLETFACPKGQGMPSIKDLSPLTSRPMLKKLDLYGNRELKDLSPLSACTALQTLVISCCPLITSLAPLSACIKLRTLNIDNCRLITNLAPLSACLALETLNISHCPLINSLAPLSTLVNLKDLRCRFIHPQASLLPLISCTGLTFLHCDNNVDLEELRRRMPQLKIVN